MSLEEAFFGAKKSVQLQTAEIDERGQVRRKTKQYDVSIPPGTENGARMRLAGQGGEGAGGGAAGDLYLRVGIAPHPRFHLSGRDLVVDLPVSPWEAALGTKVDLQSMNGALSLTVPPGTQCGQKLRLKGRHKNGSKSL